MLYSSCRATHFQLDTSTARRLLTEEVALLCEQATLFRQNKAMLNLLVLCVTVSFALLLQISSVPVAFFTSFFESIQLVMTTLVLQTQQGGLNYLYDSWKFLTFLQIVEYYLFRDLVTDIRVNRVLSLLIQYALMRIYQYRVLQAEKKQDTIAQQQKLLDFIV